MTLKTLNALMIIVKKRYFSSTLVLLLLLLLSYTRSSRRKHPFPIGASTVDWPPVNKSFPPCADQTCDLNTACSQSGKQLQLETIRMWLQPVLLLENQHSFYLQVDVLTVFVSCIFLSVYFHSRMLILSSELRFPQQFRQYSFEVNSMFE